MHHLLYHANCADGFAAACIARHALISRGTAASDINPQPVNYGLPDQMPLGKDGILFPGDTVTYLDYTPPPETLEAFFAEHGDSIPLTILDHHEKAAILHGRDKTGRPLEGTADTPVRFTSVFDIKRSGAGIAWAHFMPADSFSPVVALIQWRDLSHAFDPNFKEHNYTADALNLHAYLFRCLPRTFDAWTPLLVGTRCTGSDDPLTLATTTGARLRAIDQSIILSAAANPHWLNFHGEEIPAVNGLDAGLVSDACTALLKAYPTAPFAASWFINPTTGLAVYSLRSRRGSPVNVSDIAASMAPGGGGHPNAAGFSTPIPIPFV